MFSGRELPRLSVFPKKHLLLCAFAVFLAACGHPEAASKKSEPEATAKPAAIAPEGVVLLGSDAPELKQITIEPMRAIPLPSDEVTAPAKIELNPNRVAHATLPIPGRIVRVMVKLGDSVKAGDPVVIIESPAAGEAESAYVQAENLVRQAELAAAKADADLTRVADLFEHQAIAKKEVLSAQTALALSKASVEQAKSGVEQAQRRLQLLGLKPGQLRQQVTVTAPISGKVLEINVVEGEFHNETSTSLLKIADLSRVWVSSDVPESDIRYCHVGGRADLELIAYPNETFRGQVTRLADTVDTETRTIKVIAELDNAQGRLRPAMFGRLRYAGAVVPTLWVPESAVVQYAGKDVVFVEQSPGRFLATPVDLGRRHEAGFAVSHGLTVGQRVVTAGAIYLKASL